jgi:hypothetical protein
MQLKIMYKMDSQEIHCKRHTAQILFLKAMKSQRLVQGETIDGREHG